MQLAVATALVAAGEAPRPGRHRGARPTPARAMPAPHRHRGTRGGGPRGSPARPTTRPPWPSSSSSSRRSSASSACTRRSAAGRWPACWRRRCTGGPIVVGKVIVSLVAGARLAERHRGRAPRSSWARAGVTRSRSRLSSWPPPSRPRASPLLAVAFTRTEEQAGSAVAVVTMLLAVLGGSFFPANQGPELLSQVEPR